VSIITKQVQLVCLSILFALSATPVLASSYSYDFNYRLDNNTQTATVATLDIAQGSNGVDFTLSTADMSFLGGTPFIMSLSFGDANSYAAGGYTNYSGDADLKSFKAENGVGTFDFGWIASFNTSNAPSADRLISNESVAWTMTTGSLNDYITMISANNSSLSTVAELHINAINNGDSVKYITQISAVPLPLPIFLMLAGLGLIGLTSSKRNKLNKF